MQIFFIILSFVLTLSYAITASIDATDMEIKKCKEAKLKNQYNNKYLVHMMILILNIFVIPVIIL